MQDVPKIVLKRLPRRVPKAGSAHPDADVLTAFLERGLEEGERGQVVEHLATCDDCREVVAFSLPVNESVAATANPAVRGWMSWPVLRWGLVAVGLLIVTSVGMVEYKQRHTESAAMVSNTLQSLAPATPARNPSASSAGQATLPPTNTEKQAPPRAEMLSSPQGAVVANKTISSGHEVFPQPQPQPQAMRRVNPAVGIGGAIGGGSGGGMEAQLTQQQSTSLDSLSVVAPTDAKAGAAAKQTPPAQNYTRVVVSGAAEAVEVEAPQSSAQASAAQLQNEVPLQGRDLANLGVVKAKEPNQPASAAPMPVESSARAGSDLHASPTWTISSAGTLQRSFDLGKSWEDVNVEAASVDTSMLRRSAAGDAEQKVTKKVTSKDRRDEGQPGPAFRAVAVLGSEVWAGGSGAVLYRTTDSGLHWARVRPSEADAVLTGDIISIQFSDLQHGIVATSSGEFWNTTDNGQSWHKQQ